MILICFYILAGIVSLILTLRHVIKTTNKITLCDLILALILNLFWPVTALILLLSAIDYIIIYKKKE